MCMIGNSQVKDNKIDLLVQQYEQFTILEEEYIDSGLARFNTIITSLKALDEGFSSKNYVRKFLRALHPKWRAKVTAIEESKDLSSLALDELIGNLKVHEVVMEKDSEIYRGKKERVKSIALKAKKESSDDETSTSGSDDKEYVMAVRNFKKFFRRKGKFVRQPREEKKSFRQRDEKKGKSDRKCFRCGDPNHLIGDCPKPPRNKDQKAFIGGSWSDSENDAEDKTNDETCLMAQSSNEVTLNSSYYSDNASSLDNDSMQLEYDNLCEISLKIINKNKVLKTKRDLLEKEILELNEKIKKLERNKEIDITCKSCQELKLENARLKETQVKFVKFDKSANSLREMLNNQKSSSCKIGLGFDSSKASTSGTKPINFVGSSAEIAPDGSTIKAHGSTIPGSVDPSSGEKAAEHVFSPPMSSRSDFVITRKKLIHNKIEESKKPSLKSGLGYVKTESRSKTPPPRRNNFSQPRHNTPQPRRNSREPIHQNFYPMNWNNNQSQGFVHMGNCIPFQYPNQLQQLQGMYNTNVCLRTCLEPDEWIKDSGCSKHMINNKSLFSTYKAYGEVQFGAYCDAQGITHNFSAPRTPQSNGVVERKNRTLQEMSRTMLNEQSIPQKFWCNAVDTSTYILNRILIRPILGKTPYEIFRGRKPSLEYFKVFGSKCFILNTKDYLTKFDPKSYEGVFLGYSQNSKAYVVLNKHTMKVKESLNVTFDESPPTKLSPLVDDDVGEEEAIRKNTKIVNINNEEDESIEVDEIVNIKESKNHPLDQVIGNLNQRTLRSQAQNHSNFFCFISTIEPKNVNEALKDESWVVAMQEELNQFIANDVWELVPLPISQSVIGTKWVFRNKLDENGIVSRNKARLVAQGYNQQEGIYYDETYAPVARLESIRILLAIACANNFKLYQMDVKSAFLNGFINEEYIKEMLKKFGLEDSKPTKTPMSTEIKLTKNDEADSVDSSKYQGEIMPQLNLKDYQRTKAYLPRIHRSKAMDEEVRESYRRLKSRLFHEGRFVTPSFIEANNMLPTF
ncbi:zf-CCHC domain-containing protein [Tanacetum coccineum]